MVKDVHLGGKRVRIHVTENEGFMVGCEFKKDVTGTRWEWGGGGYKKVIDDLINESLEAGGDLLIIRQKSRGNFISSASGTAYRCFHPDDSFTTPAPNESVDSKRLAREWKPKKER